MLYEVITVLGIAVVGPVRNMMSRIKDIAEDKADLANRLNDSARDEIGELASWFNRLMGRLEAILCDVEGYKNLVDAVPDPIFGVDEEFHILIVITSYSIHYTKLYDHGQAVPTPTKASGFAVQPNMHL